MSQYPKAGILDFLVGSETYILRKHAYLLRKTEYYLNTEQKLFYCLYKFLLARLQNKYGMHVRVNCCGKGLRIMHVGPILINGNAIIGKNCILHINVGIVAGGTNDFCPVLGDDIILSFGAAIVGDVHVADKVVVGANSVVNRDVIEEDITVAGIPAKKVSSVGSSAWTAEYRRQQNEILMAKRNLTDYYKV